MPAVETPFEAQFPVDEGQLPKLLAFVEQAALTMALPPPLRFKLLLLAEELYLNTVQHGGTCRGDVWLRLGLGEGALQFDYEDAAAAYDPFAQTPREPVDLPLAERPIGRLGVLLVEGLARETRYTRQDGRNRIALRLAL